MSINESSEYKVTRFSTKGMKQSALYSLNQDKEEKIDYLLFSPGKHPRMKPIRIPKSVPDQGLADAPQVLPAHWPKYPYNAPNKAPTEVVITIVRTRFFI